jgi:alkylation response protein AidB-like acyl-CoA dehydrogenase
VETDLAEDRRMLRTATAKFLQDLGGLQRLRALADDPLGYDPDARRQGADLGWFAMLIPERYGGGSVTGQGLLDLVEMAEELGRVLYPGPFLPTNVVAYAISEFGSEVQQQELLPRIAAGDATAAWCLTESSGSYDVATISLAAGQTSDGFILNGTKSVIQDAHVADIFLVTAKSDHGHLVQLLVPANTMGVTTRQLSSLDLNRRFADVHFANVKVPSTALLGDPALSTEAVDRQLAIAMTLQCADSVGGLSKVNEMTFEYANDRFAFGRPIASFQSIKHKCVDMYLALLGARSITAAAAEAVQEWSSEAMVIARIAKAFVGDAFSLGTEHCHQIHGGIAHTWDHDAHLFSRRSKSNEILFGSPEWHRDQLGRALGL